jgi:hypothetical protein
MFDSWHRQFVKLVFFGIPAMAGAPGIPLVEKTPNRMPREVETGRCGLSAFTAS